MRAKRADVAAIVLAAGESKRMGRAKALLRHGGRTFLETICSRLREAGLEEIVVVLGAGATAIKKEITLERERVVANERFRDGQLSSLRCGLRAVDARAGAALVTLVDHPLIAASTYVAARAAWERGHDKIITVAYRGRGGHPVIFPRSVFGELMDAPVDVGARFVVWRDRSRVVRVECNDPGIVADIDYPEDYEAFVKSDCEVHADEPASGKRNRR